jgi:sodium transport system ATP-binding protein
VIEVQGLCKRFLDYQRGWKDAITDISFECKPGAIFGLLGPNGAGKTTTLRILSTVLKPTGGRATIAGHDVVTDPEGVRASIGYMSASTGIYDRMTAWELVEYFGQLYGMPRERLRERMEDIFNWLKMNDFRDILGSKSGLDGPGARAVLQNILELRDRGKTIVFSTHSMHEVEKLCSRVAIIHRGRVQAEGAPPELLDQFDQPDLEELFFYLVERADKTDKVAGSKASAAGEFSR